MTRATPIPDTITIHVPFRVVKRGGRKEMHLPDGAATQRRPDNALVKALARAFRWKRMLESGEFATIAELAEREGIAEFMKDAQLMIQKPGLLVKAVNMIHELPLTEGDTKGDLYEYLLSKLTTAGINGQFRTPRHIIRLMVDMLEPRPTDVIGDPACGTGGCLSPHSRTSQPEPWRLGTVHD